jgi:alanine dehydrogenase
MPGAVPRTSTYALNNATLPHVIELCDKGYIQALADNPHLRNGLNVHKGDVTNHEVAKELGYAFVEPLQSMAV